MVYASQNLPKLIINDRNWKRFTKPPKIHGIQMSCGYIERDWGTNPLYGNCKKPQLKIITDVNDQKSIIEENERKGYTLKHLREYKGIESLDQNGTNYCWCNGVTQCMHYRQAKDNEPLIRLSPGSVAAVIKNGRNEGGWGDEAAKHMMAYGIAPQSEWPANSRDLSLNTARMKKIKALNKINPDAWYEIEPGQSGWNELVTWLLYGEAVAVAFNWWSHLVCAIGVVIDERGEICLLIDNSWGMGWGDRGLGLIKGSKKYPAEGILVLGKMATEDYDVSRMAKVTPTSHLYELAG